MLMGGERFVYVVLSGVLCSVLVVVYVVLSRILVTAISSDKTGDGLFVDWPVKWSVLVRILLRTRALLDLLGCVRLAVYCRPPQRLWYWRWSVVLIAAGLLCHRGEIEGGVARRAACTCS